jgi:predicted ATPase/DNA-binding SARP family transcriptional activator
VEYGVLGQLMVSSSGQDVTPSGQRARDLLATLLVKRDQSVDPLLLLDLVWGGESAPPEASVVHTVVARLRRTLGRDAIETTGRGYRLRPETTDEQTFMDLVAQAERARTGEPDRAIGLLREALGLWRADRAYADITDELVVAEVARLREVRAAATENLGELLLERGAKTDVEELILLAEEFVGREPMLERAHELLMLGLFRAGRQVEALVAYDRLRVMLRDELGVDPSASTRQLHQQMLDQDPGLQVVAPRPPRRARPTPPAPTTPLVGREEELDRVLTLLDDRRLVVLTGLGGVGKSRLLSEVHRRLDDGQQSAFLDLATIEDAERDDLVEALGRTLEISLDADDALGSVARSLAPLDLVLMIDEAERSTTPLAELLGGLLGRCPSLRVLAASRRPLGVVGETNVALDPLPVPPSGADVETTAASASVRLLRARIGDHAPALVLGDAELPLLGRLARRADGLPLALELLAGYAGTHSLSELDAVLDTPTELASDEEGRPERHRTLRDTILWSVERLAEGHREVLRRLGIFSASFDLSAALAVVGGDAPDVDRAVRSLVREGLIQARREDGALLLRLPRPVRDLAWSGLVEHDELAAARARHRRWYATERWRDELRNDALLADMRRHYPDYLVALRTGLEDGDGDAVGAVALTLGRFWGFTDMASVGVRWFEEVLRSGLATPIVEARIRAMRAHLAVHVDPPGVREDLAAALPVLVAEDDAPFLVTAYIIQALEGHASGELEPAAVAARLAVEASSRAAPERQADALGVLALVESSIDPVAAADAAQLAWGRARSCGNPASRASVATNVALALLELGRATEALTLLRGAAAEMGAEAVPLFLVFNTAWAELACGAPEAALTGFTHVLAATGDVPGDRRAAEALTGAACALAELDRPQAPEVVAGAREMLTRSGLTLQEFQRSRLERAGAATAPWSGVAWPEHDVALGLHLTSLVTGSAAVQRRSPAHRR